MSLAVAAKLAKGNTHLTCKQAAKSILYARFSASACNEVLVRLLDGLSAEDLQLSEEARRIFGVSGPSQVKATDNVFILDQVFLLPA